MTASEAYHKAAYIRGRYPEGEAVIATDAFFSYEYALLVIGGRWEPGERAISTHYYWSFHYAANIIRSRWKAGEIAIATNLPLCKIYIQMVLDSDKKYKTDPDFMAFVLAHG